MNKPSIEMNVLISLLDKIPLGLYHTTPDGRILFANETLIKLLGFESADQLYQRNLEENGFEPGYPREEFKRLIEEQGEISNLESAWIRSDGGVVYVRENAKLLTDEKGKITGYVGIVEDITSKKYHEEEIKKTHENFRNLFQSSPDALIVQDRDRRIIDVNKSAEELFGYTREELINNPDIKLADLEKTNRTLASIYLEKAFQGIPQRFEWWGKRKDGTSFPEEVVMTCTEYEGQKVVFLTIRDISERKYLETALNNQLRYQQAISRISSRFITLPTEQFEQGVIESINEVICLMNLECSYLFLMNSDGEVERVIGTCREEKSDLEKRIAEVQIPADSWLISQMKAGKFLFRFNVDAFPDSARTEKEFLRSLNLDNVSFFPLSFQDELLGFFGLGGKDDQSLGTDEELLTIRLFIEILTNLIVRIREEKMREELIQNLQETLAQVKTLSGLLPICSNCKKIRDDKGYWHQVESYISSHTQAQFSHGLCPECMKKLYPAEYEKIFGKKPNGIH